MAKKIFMLADGSIAHNFKELALLLAVEKVTREDVAEGGQYSDLVEVVEVEDGVTEDIRDSDEATEDTKKKRKGGSKKQDPNVDKTKIYSTVNPEDVTATEEEIKLSLPTFESLDELKEFIKDIDTATLEYMARGLKIEWSPTYHASIHRMRVALAFQQYFFPELFKPKEPKKKATKYGDFTTEDLEKLAKDSNVKWNKTGNEPIDRMKLIMALKASGHLPN